MMVISTMLMCKHGILHDQIWVLAFLCVCSSLCVAWGQDLFLYCRAVSLCLRGIWVYKHSLQCYCVVPLRAALNFSIFLWLGWRSFPRSVNSSIKWLTVSDPAHTIIHVISTSWWFVCFFICCKLYVAVRRRHLVPTFSIAIQLHSALNQFCKSYRQVIYRRLKVYS